MFVRLKRSIGFNEEYLEEEAKLVIIRTVRWTAELIKSGQLLLGESQPLHDREASMRVEDCVGREKIEERVYAMLKAFTERKLVVCANLIARMVEDGELRYKSLQVLDEEDESGDNSNSPSKDTPYQEKEVWEEGDISEKRREGELSGMVQAASTCIEEQWDQESEAAGLQVGEKNEDEEIDVSSNREGSSVPVHFQAMNGSEEERSNEQQLDLLEQLISPSLQKILAIPRFQGESSDGYMYVCVSVLSSLISQKLLFTSSTTSISQQQLQTQNAQQNRSQEVRNVQKKSGQESFQPKKLPHTLHFLNQQGKETREFTRYLRVVSDGKGHVPEGYIRFVKTVISDNGGLKWRKEAESLLEQFGLSHLLKYLIVEIPKKQIKEITFFPYGKNNTTKASFIGRNKKEKVCVYGPWTSCDARQSLSHQERKLQLERVHAWHRTSIRSSKQCLSSRRNVPSVQWSNTTERVEQLSKDSGRGFKEECGEPGEVYGGYRAGNKQNRAASSAECKGTRQLHICQHFQQASFR